jgi:carbonic anhydrase
MSEPVLLQLVLEANKKFLAGTPQTLDAAGATFIVVACTDPRLTGLLEPALGLPRHRAAVIRTAGNIVGGGHREVLRSIACGIFLRQASEVFIVGHTDCALASFSAADAAESFRKAGVPRSAFGDEDLRTWFGAFSSARSNVAEGVSALRRSGLLPPALKVHGLVIDSQSGALEVVVDGNAAPVSAAARVEAPVPEPHKAPEEKLVFASAPEHGAPVPPIPPPAEPEARKAIVIGDSGRQAAPGAPKTRMTYVDGVMQLRKVFDEARRNPKMRRSLTELAAAVEQERDPARVLGALDRLRQEFAPLYPEISPALDALQGAFANRKGGRNMVEMLRRLLE